MFGFSSGRVGHSYKLKKVDSWFVVVSDAYRRYAFFIIRPITIGSLNRPIISIESALVGPNEKGLHIWRTSGSLPAQPHRTIITIGYHYYTITITIAITTLCPIKRTKIVLVITSTKIN